MIKIPYSSRKNPYKVSIPCGKDFFESWVRLQLDGKVENESLHIREAEKFLQDLGVPYRFSRPPLPSAAAAEYRIYGMIRNMKFVPTECTILYRDDNRTWFDIDSALLLGGEDSSNFELTPIQFARYMLMNQMANSVFLSDEKRKGEFGTGWEIEFVLREGIPARSVWETDWADNMRGSYRIEIAVEEDRHASMIEGIRSLLTLVDREFDRADIGKSLNNVVK